jgi:hypothetical protein
MCKTMADKQIKQPGPDHPITIEANPARVVVSVAGRVVADTQDALTLREAGYPRALAGDLIGAVAPKAGVHPPEGQPPSAARC